MIITPNHSELEQIYSNVPGNGNGQCEDVSKYLTEKYRMTIVTTYEGEKKHIRVTLPGRETFINFKYVETDRNIHGTGCAFSSALACCIAKGMDVFKSVEQASIYVSMKVENRSLYNENGQYFF
jgi:hydroxymethylpyrimidine/phosphomethylpyrimidine kinase